MKLKDALKKGAITCTRDLPLEEVAELMKVNDVGAVVVVNDEQRAIGIVTDRDIVLRAVSEGMESTIAVESVITPVVHVLGENADLFEAIRAMQEAEVRRIPVVDSGGRVVSLVSMGDILRVTIGNLAKLLEEVTSETEKLPAAA